MIILNDLPKGLELPSDRNLEITSVDIYAEVVDGEYIGEQIWLSHKINLDVLGWWYYDTCYGVWFWEKHLDFID